MAKPRRKPTPEEYEEDKKIIKAAYEAGLPKRRMKAMFGYTETYIKKIRETLLSEGSLTDDIIKVASEKYYKENPNAQGLNKTKVRKPKKIKGKHNKTLEKRERIFELVMQKLSKTQIAREMQLSLTGVSWHIDELIKEGRLTDDQVEKESSQDGVGLVDKNSPEYIEKRDQIVGLLQKGYKNHFIRKKLDITPLDFDIYIRNIRESNIMTTAQIKEARKRKRQEDLKFVEECVNNEISINEMRELRPEFAANEITPMIKELISKGVITQEQVDTNRKNANRKTTNKGLKMSPDEQVEFIRKKVEKGYSPEEIVEADTTKSITIHKAQYQKRKLIAEGIIPQEVADRAMQERQEKAIKRKRKRVMKKMKQYTELGYTLQEMSEGLIKEYSRSELSQIKEEYEDELGWYTKEELKEFARLRKQREYDALPEDEKRRIEEEKLAKAKQIEDEKKQRQQDALNKLQEQKDETIKKQLMDAETLKEHLKKCRTMQKSAELMKVSLAYTYKIRKISIANGTWLTEEELKAIEKKKKQKQARQRRAREKKKAQEEAEKKKKRQEEVLARRQAGKDETKKRYIADAEKLKPHIKDGKTIGEAAKLNGFKEQYAYIIRRASIANGAWLTKEELKEIERKQKEKIEQARKEKEEAKRKKQEEKKAREQKKAEEQKRKQQEALARKEEREEATRKKHEADAEKLKSHIKDEKTIAEAARLSNLDYQYALKIIKEGIQNGTWLTEEEQKEIERKKQEKILARQKAAEEAKKKKQEEEKKAREKRKEEEQLRVKKEIWKMREYVEQGYTTVEEIAKKMNYSTSYTRNLIKKAIEDNIWFSDKAIQEFKRVRQIREEREAKKAQEAEQRILENERREAQKAIKEAEKTQKALERDRGRKIRGYIAVGKKYRKEAKREDGLELDGEENVSTKGRRKFIEILEELHNLDADISNRDIEIVLNAFDMHPEIADVKSIKFLIADASKKGGIKATERMTITLADSLRNTKFYTPLIEYRRWMKKYALRPKILELKEQGMDNTAIGQKLGISSAEVSIIFRNDKKPDFSDPGNR